jgi:hypothetical protein
MLIASTTSIASCGSCGQSVACESSSPYNTDCQCTDPGVIRNNPCMSRDKYCEVFGNVGAR